MVENLRIFFPICEFGNLLLYKNNSSFNTVYNGLNSRIFFDVVFSVFYYYINQLRLLRLSNIVVKTRKCINYSTKKLYKQKGTGRSRIGSKKSPLLKGGSASFVYKSKYKKLKILKKRTRVIIFYVLVNKRAHLMVTLMFTCLHKYCLFNNFLIDYLNITKAINFKDVHLISFFTNDFLKNTSSLRNIVGLKNKCLLLVL